MPKEISNLRDFLVLTRKKSCKSVTVHKRTVTAPSVGGRNVSGAKQVTKFKLRGKYLYTLKMDDPEKATRLIQTLPPTILRYTTDKKKQSSKK